jgi:hypothetical protein
MNLVLPQAQQVMFEPESLPRVHLVPDRSNAPSNLDVLFVTVTQEDFTKQGVAKAQAFLLFYY